MRVSQKAEIRVDCHAPDRSLLNARGWPQANSAGMIRRDDAQETMPVCPCLSSPCRSPYDQLLGATGKPNARNPLGWPSVLQTHSPSISRSPQGVGHSAEQAEGQQGEGSADCGQERRRFHSGEPQWQETRIAPAILSSPKRPAPREEETGRLVTRRPSGDTRRPTCSKALLCFPLSASRKTCFPATDKRNKELACKLAMSVAGRRQSAERFLPPSLQRPSHFDPDRVPHGTPTRPSVTDRLDTASP